MSEFKEENPIRVLQVTGIMNRGGAETMIMNLYRNMDRSKVQFDFVENSLEPGAYDEEIRRLGGRIFYCPHYTGKNHLSYCHWWRDFWKEHRDDYLIVHGHIGSVAALYLFFARKIGAFTIAHSHGANSNNLKRRIPYQVFSFPTRWIADFFIACSGQAGLDRFGKQVTQNAVKYFVMNNAIDDRTFQFESERRGIKRNELGLSEREFVIGHVGRFTGEKNHSFLLDVFSELNQRVSHTRLILIGDGPLKSEIQKKAVQIGISDNVAFLGVRSDVADLMQAMDVLVFPSKNEGLPVTLVEAQTSGLPCVISDSIPSDCILCDDLVTTVSLQKSAAFWAETVLGRKGELRRDHAAEVSAAGFDIHQTAKWLEDFYLEKAKR